MSFIIMNEWRIEESLFINQHIFWFPKKNHFSLINYCNKLEDRPWKLIFWILTRPEVQKSFSEPFAWILWFQVSSSIKTCLKLWNLFIGKIVNAAILFFYKKQFLKLCWYHQFRFTNNGKTQSQLFFHSKIQLKNNQPLPDNISS